MRANEGYRHWKMVFIEDFPCDCKLEKEARLQYWIDELKPTLNHQCSAKEYEKYEAMWAKQNKRGYRVRKGVPAKKNMTLSGAHMCIVFF